MAKQRGPVASTFSGRVGNVVGAKLKGGEYVSRSYQPSVKNPNTLRQRVSRLRMATASQLAAGLAPAIQAGYGLAAGSTRMYPRNMFVRDLVRLDSDPALTVTNEVATVTYSKLNLSQRLGITAHPAMGILDLEEPITVKIPFDAVTVTDVLPEGNLGLVIAVYCPEENSTAMEMMTVTQGQGGTVEMGLPASFSGKTVHVYAFLKWIPKSKNDVTTDVEPWKYPSETGETVYVGTGTVG